jgi:hypothetical protein
VAEQARKRECHLGTVRHIRGGTPPPFHRRNVLHLSPVGSWHCAKYRRNPNGFYVGEFSVGLRNSNHLVPVEAITDESPGSFVGWCEQHNHHCSIGQFGAPRQDARYMSTLECALAYMRDHNISGTYWVGDPWGGVITTLPSSLPTFPTPWTGRRWKC